jgi:DNA-binding IclR family transcriptional regulator
MECPVKDQIRLTTVTKALKLIELVAETWEGLTLTEISAALDLPKSSVTRYLATLEDREYVERDGLTLRYRLGGTLIRLAMAGARRWDIHGAAFPVMLELREALGETINLGVPRGSKIVYLEVLEGFHPLRTAETLGEDGPMHATALGKAIMACMPVEQLEAVLRDPLRRYTMETITDPLLLKRELEWTRERGFAIDNCESIDGVRCVAAAILNSGNTVVGAISASGPANRISPERARDIGPEVVKAAFRVSRLLGYIGKGQEGQSSPHSVDQGAFGVAADSS